MFKKSIKAKDYDGELPPTPQPECIKEEEICQKAIETWGKEKQMDMVVEECSELIKTIVKYRRYNGYPVWRLNILEEAADVSIVIRQIILMLSNEEEWSRIRDNKLKKLEAIIKNDDPERGMKK